MLDLQNELEAGAAWAPEKLAHYLAYIEQLKKVSFCYHLTLTPRYAVSDVTDIYCMMGKLKHRVNSDLFGRQESPLVFFGVAEGSINRGAVIKRLHGHLLISEVPTDAHRALINPKVQERWLDPTKGFEYFLQRVHFFSFGGSAQANSIGNCEISEIDYQLGIVNYVLKHVRDELFVDVQHSDLRF